MSQLEERIQKDFIEAMKAHETEREIALKDVKTAISREKCNGAFHELTDNDVVKLIQKEVKQREESIAGFEAGGRHESAGIERERMNYLLDYLPKMLTEAELNETIDGLITETGASSMKDMGKVIKTLNERYPNRVDGKLASTIIKGRLS